MSSQSNAMPESSLRPQGTATTAIPAARLMYWSVRRELWEIRSIYVAPVAAACLFLFGFSISILHLLVAKHAAPSLDLMQQRELFGMHAATQYVCDLVPRRAASLAATADQRVASRTKCYRCRHGGRRPAKQSYGRRVS